MRDMNTVHSKRKTNSLKQEKSSTLNGKHAIKVKEFLVFTYSGKNEENTHLLLGEISITYLRDI